MKKIIIFLFIIVIGYILCNSKKEQILLPDDTIRFRIIANSNSYEDQKLKWDINKDLIPILTDITKSSDIENTKDNINQNMNKIKNIVNKHTDDYNINYGKNYFPEKEYKGVKYKEGNYDSLVITLGNGIGDNWWCVLFPPLCLMESTEENYDNITYTTYIKKIINQYF